MHWLNVDSQHDVAIWSWIEPAAYIFTRSYMAVQDKNDAIKVDPALSKSAKPASSVCPGIVSTLETPKKSASAF